MGEGLPHSYVCRMDLSRERVLREAAIGREIATKLGYHGNIRVDEALKLFDEESGDYMQDAAHPIDDFVDRYIFYIEAAADLWSDIGLPGLVNAHREVAQELRNHRDLIVARLSDRRASQ